MAETHERDNALMAAPSVLVAMGADWDMHRLLLVFAAVGAVMIFVFSSAQWYADNAAVPRYCEDPEGAVHRVGLILKESQPVGSEAKRPFIVAAKLIFLVPQKDEEPVADYLNRLSGHIRQACAQR